MKGNYSFFENLIEKFTETNCIYITAILCT